MSNERDSTAERLSDLERPIARLEILFSPQALARTGGGRTPDFPNDAEVIELLNRELWDGSLDQVLGGVERTFGAERAPSRSALGRYRKRQNHVTVNNRRGSGLVSPPTNTP